MIGYTLPGLMEFADVNLFFAEAYRARPDMFRDGVRLESVYGGFAGSMLSGGRNSPGPALSPETIRARVKRYNDLGMRCNVTFSNQLATATSLSESPFDRRLLEILDEGEGNGVIVYSDELACVLRQEFPQLTLIASTTKALAAPESVEAACELYDCVVLDYNFTKDEAFIRALSSPARIEVMVNEYCTLGCPFRAEHYRAVSEAQLQGRQADFPCRHEPAPQAYGFLNGLVNGDVFLRNEDIERYHDVFGIRSFKVVGRGLARYDIVDSYLYYLVQPDCWYEFRDFLIHHGFF